MKKLLSVIARNEATSAHANQTLQRSQNNAALPKKSEPDSYRVVNRKSKVAAWLSTFLCSFQHNWRSDANNRRRCTRCGAKEKRAIYDWQRWVKETNL